MIYSKIEVVDGDTIKYRSWPFGLEEVCRIEGLDCDEMGTKRGEDQKRVLERICARWFFKPYIVVRYRKGRLGRKVKRCGRGRAIVRVYMWSWRGYRDYSRYMVQSGQVKRGSKWNEK